MIYIVTPTYNRKLELTRLFNSLLRQTRSDFIWIVIDDGSDDGTKDMLNKMIVDNSPSFQYIYIYQENSGKHIAYNTALDYMGGRGYHVVVDSDDFLSDQAIEYFYEDTYKIHQDTIGVVYPKHEIGKKNKWLEDNISYVDIPEIKFRYNLSIETTILLKNSILSKIRLKQFSQEKFLSEETFYYDISEIGKFIPINRELYYFEYLDQGMTKNTFNLWKKNPKGTQYLLERRKKYIAANLVGKQRIFESIKVMMNIKSFEYYLSRMKYFQKSPIVNTLLYPIVYIVYIRRFK